MRDVHLDRLLRAGGNRAVHDRRACERILQFLDGITVCDRLNRTRDCHLHATVYADQPLGWTLGDDGVRDHRLQEGGVGALASAQQLDMERMSGGIRST